MTDQTFDDVIPTLRTDADGATWELGYLRAVLDNYVVGEKLQSSYSGYAMEVATVAVKHSLALYCARAWDESSGSISIPNVTKLLPAIPSLRERWMGWYANSTFHHLVDRDEARLSAYMTEFEQALADKSHPPLRVFRSEFLAHRITHSNDRKKFEKREPVGEITLNELVVRAEQSVKLVGELGYLSDGTANPYPDRIKKAERYCREFWRVLPVLGDVEDSNID